MFGRYQIFFLYLHRQKSFVRQDDVANNKLGGIYFCPKKYKRP
jgi:hypothetical protein